MNDDLLQQWQTWAGWFAPSGFAAHDAAARHGTAGFTPFAEAAEQFKAAAQAYLAAAAGGSSQSAAQAAQQFGEFLREQFAQAQLPWAVGFGPGRPGAQPGSSSDAPALGAMREHQQRWQRMAEAWRRVEDSQRRLQRMWSDALRESAAAFAVRLQQQPAGAAASPERVRELYDSWVECAEDGYARLAHSAAFCDTQAELVNASSLWRREAQAGIEQWAKLLDLPTRSELNTLVRRLKLVEQQLQAAGVTPSKIEP